ncbi:MAG: hypothetical protein J3K34DRAFT_283041 [Monoraphidium minutum]|nr:MAG: hypothetical protein J3K34DRAFT_283041 [Monoraphidium minutum]
MQRTRRVWRRAAALTVPHARGTRWGLSHPWRSKPVLMPPTGAHSPWPLGQGVLGWRRERGPCVTYAPHGARPRARPCAWRRRARSLARASDHRGASSLRGGARPGALLRSGAARRGVKGAGTSYASSLVSLRGAGPRGSGWECHERAKSMGTEVTARHAAAVTARRAPAAAPASCTRRRRRRRRAPRRRWRPRSGTAPAAPAAPPRGTPPPRRRPAPPPQSARTRPFAAAPHPRTRRQPRPPRRRPRRRPAAPARRRRAGPPPGLPPLWTAAAPHLPAPQKSSAAPPAAAGPPAGWMGAGVDGAHQAGGWEAGAGGRGHGGQAAVWGGRTLSLFQYSEF